MEETMTKRPRSLELLAPAGDMERLTMAVLYGADAVYLAGTSFGMRSFAGNFTPEELPRAVALAHDAGRAGPCHGEHHAPRRRGGPRCRGILEELDACRGRRADSGGPGGVHAGGAVCAPLRAAHVHPAVHRQLASAPGRWYDLGASRVVLARELSLEEIRAHPGQETPPELELETFAHGAMCVSYSGRCLLSNYMTGRDSNRGACAQPCRYQYALMEEKRPGEYFPVFEDEKGTYILNSRDMCMIDHLDDLMDAGVDCIKLEGRAKSAYYAAIVTGGLPACALMPPPAGTPVGPGMAG